MAWEAAGGVALLAAAVAALVWANVAPDAYASFWAAEVAGHPLTAIVNDGLMTIFFLLIGLEVKRELAIGELSDRRAAALPFAAALGGMLVPAGIYLAITAGSPAATGWGIPMATDVAFALAVLASLKSRVPPSLWAFLLGVAVIDDIGAIIVIAVAYSDGITAGWLAAGIGSLLAFWVLVRMQVRWVAPYVVVGVAAWAFTALSGVHATIAGVAIGLLIPATIAGRPPEKAPLARTVHALHPWSSFLILPLFALANAGIVFGAGALDADGALAAMLGVSLGLLVGKAVGLPLGAWLAVRTGVGRMPTGARWGQIAGIGLLAGIGFTVSLFITDLAFDDAALEDAARIGVLAGSVVAAIAGALVLVATGRRRNRVPGEPAQG
jgi:NhaA family Na+:H+ antiporter